MTTMPLFTPWQMTQLKPLYDVLRALPPADAYRLMRDLHDAEREHVLGEMHASTAAHVRSRIASAPRLAEHYDVDTLAHQFADYLLELNFDSAFLLMLLSQPDKLAQVVDMGNVETKVGMGNVTLKADLGAVTYEAMQGIELKVGQSSIKIDQTGVTIKGMMVKIEGQIQTEVKGLMTTVKADAILMVKGSLTMIN